MLKNSLPSVEQLSIKCGGLDVSQNCEPPQPVMGIPLPYFHIFCVLFKIYMIQVSYHQ
jgi:hypothetical protein